MLLIAFLPVVAQEDTTAVLGVHPFDSQQNIRVANSYAHWSILPHVGFNVFDGDFNGEMRHPIGWPSAGLGVEYTFTPVFGVGVEYMFSRYGVSGKNPGVTNADTLLLGHTHNASAYLGLDLMGLFFPHSKSKLLSLNAMIGGGYGWYKTSVMYHDDYDPAKPATATHMKGKTLTYINANGVKGPDAMDIYHGAPFLKFGLNIEFNINRLLAIGLRGAYHYYFTDEIDGRGYAGEAGLASKNNDGLLDVTLNLRIKFASKEHSHVRNIGGSEPDLQIAKRLEALENASMQPVAAPSHDTVIIYHDTIIEIRDMRAPAPAPVVINRQESNSFYYIYFRPGSAAIDNAGLTAIQQVADRMKTDPTLFAVVTGYCDNTGSDRYNFVLGDKRADNVIEELSEEHEIPIERLYAGGVGKLVGKRSKAAYGPNRRAVIQLVDEETFMVLSAELEQHRAQREAELQQPEPEVVEAEEVENRMVIPAKPVVVKKQKPAAVPQLEEGEEIVEVDENTTLSRLARKYYNNTHSWIYIFIANEDIINPNNLRLGSTIRIPELTEEQMTISKEDCKALYQTVKRL